MFRWSVFYELWMACDNVNERAELWQAIMEYGLYNKEPPKKFKRDFVNIRFILNRSKQISEERSKAWSKHEWNQYTRGDEKRKGNDKAQNNVVEQNGTNGTNKNKNKKENENIKKEVYKKKDSSPKQLFGAIVELTQEEYGKLASKFGELTVKKYIAYMDSYCAEKHKTYSNYNLALQKWMAKDNVKELPQKKDDMLKDFEIEDGVYDIDKINSFNS